MENAKKNLVFHFGVGRQASFLKIGYVKQKDHAVMYQFFGEFHLTLVLTANFFESGPMPTPRKFLDRPSLFQVVD